MARSRYVALLRGINVGGRNKVAMADLRETLEAAGYEHVRTYIQSGNVLFETAQPAEALEADVERALERRFGVPLTVVVRSRTQYRTIVKKAPDGFGTRPDTFHSDVLFLKGTLDAKRLLAEVPRREEVDRVWAGPAVLYYERLSARRTQSKLGRIAGTPAYPQLTIRNWATTIKLLEMLDD